MSEWHHVIFNDYSRDNTLIKTYQNNAMLWKRVTKRYPYSPIQPKKIPLSQICSDLSLTLKKAPFSENFRTHMLTHIVKVVPPGFGLLFAYCSYLWIEIMRFYKKFALGRY